MNNILYDVPSYVGFDGKEISFPSEFKTGESIISCNEDGEAQSLDALPLTEKTNSIMIGNTAYSVRVVNGYPNSFKNDEITFIYYEN